MCGTIRSHLHTRHPLGREPSQACPLLSYLHDESLDSLLFIPTHSTHSRIVVQPSEDSKAIMAMYGAPNVYPSSPIMAPSSPLMMSQQQPQPFSPNNGQPIQAGQITYTSTTTPEGRIIYHPFKSVQFTRFCACICRTDRRRTIVIICSELSQRGMMGLC